MGSDEASAPECCRDGALGSDEASASERRCDGALGSDKASASECCGDGAMGSDEASASERRRDGALGSDEASASESCVKKPAASGVDPKSSVYQNGPAFKRQAFLRTVATAKLVNCPQAFGLTAPPGFCGPQRMGESWADDYQ